MRAPLAFLGAVVADVGALLLVFALMRLDGEGDRGYESLVPAAVGAAVAVVVVCAVASVLLVLYALDRATDRVAVVAVVLLGVAGPVGGGASFYLPLVAALLGGAAIAAGEPLPPPDPADDRMDRPLPRGDR